MNSTPETSGSKLIWTKPSIQTIDFHQTEGKDVFMMMEMVMMGTGPS
jgi:hypothetical protein